MNETALPDDFERRLIIATQAGLPETGYAMGADFGIADAALFYVLFWASKTQIPLPPRCLALFERIRARPVVQQVLREEGYR